MRVGSYRPKSWNGGEEVIDKRDLALNAWLFVMDVASLDGPDSFDATECRFGCSEGSGQNVVVKRQSLKPLAVRQEQQPL